MILVAPNQPDKIMQPLLDYFNSDLVVSGDIPVDYQFWGRYQDKAIKVMLERKRCPDDLYASWRDGRLKKQVLDMSENPGPNFMILEGNLSYDFRYNLRSGRYPTELSFNILSGMFLNWTMNGVYILLSPDETATARLIINTYKYFQKKSHDSLLVRPRLPSQWKRPGKRSLVIQAFQIPGSGIGVETAKKAWKHSGTLRDFMLMSEEELQDIPGIGPKIISNLSQILDMRAPRDL